MVSRETLQDKLFCDSTAVETGCGIGLSHISNHHLQNKNFDTKPANKHWLTFLLHNTYYIHPPNLCPSSLTFKTTSFNSLLPIKCKELEDYFASEMIHPQMKKVLKFCNCAFAWILLLSGFVAFVCLVMV